MTLKRKIMDVLLEWKKEEGKTALLIEGARRVGKSTIVEDFARREYETYVLIDFSIAGEDIKSLFRQYASDLDQFFFYLAAMTGVTLVRRKTLIVFDEVQMFPTARQMIKHLVRDRRFDYIETGSLLSIKKNVDGIVLPSEERSIQMFPLDFEEFCWAIGRHEVIPVLKKHFDELRPLTVLHSSMMKLFRQYILIGGMPQAILEYLESNDYEKVDRVKRDILGLYRNDIAKFAKGYESKVLAIFDEIPGQLSKHEKKFTLASLSKDARFRQYEDAFLWLSDAMIVNLCFNADDPQIGLSLHKDRMTLKAYMGDTGLLISHAFDERDEMHREIARSLIENKLEINNGMFFENVVAQMLASQNRSLYFFSRVDLSESANTMEIDFLIQDRFKPTKIAPVEVKSGRNYTTSSMDKFITKYGNKLGRKYLLHSKDLIVKNDIVYLPVYLAMFL